MPRAKGSLPEPNGNGDNPILNNPYEEPRLHYATSPDGELDYNEVIEGRRIFTADPIAIPVRQGRQRSLYEVNEYATEYFTHHVNLLRKEVGEWREAGYPASTVTRVTKELLDFWFRNPERPWELRLFFGQQEAIETAIWLNEVAPKCNAGQNILSRLQSFREEQMAHGGPEAVLPRIAFKMATGTGKTVVMGALILYHFLNRQEYRQDTRFADYFLVATPGVTIRERLGVLRVKPYNAAGEQDYYHARGLVPRQHEASLANLNSRLVITNFHSFEARVLQGNKRSPFDGKRDADGKKQEAREDPSITIGRLLKHFRAGSRVLVLNDEAHHCYLPKGRGPSADGENAEEENRRAAIWFSGLVEVARRYKVETIYDLSATPYYLSGSGFDQYSLFPWVVSDFGLIEAIESGLVKIPFIPDDDYDSGNFMVRQIFFCGGDRDEFARWRKGLSDLAVASARRRAERTLRIEMDDDAFARVYGCQSHPIQARKGRRIAVRVISQFGEESTKVLEV